MKTAISIPDDLFVSAENTAKKLGIPFGSELGFRIEYKSTNQFEAPLF